MSTSQNNENSDQEASDGAESRAWVVLPTLSQSVQFVLIAGLIFGVYQEDIYIILSAIGFTLLGIWIDLKLAL